jgi:outer membrane protein assembly factor BamD
MGQSYERLGTRFRKQEGEAYAKIVQDYPLSDYADDATRKLKELELPVPAADKSAVARMQYEKDHRVKPGLISRTTLPLRRGPDVSTAAHSGDPAMTTMRPSVPPLVPQPAGATGFNPEVTATQVGDSSALDTKPDARVNPPAASTTGTTPAADTSQQASQQTATDPNAKTTDPNAKKKKKAKKQQPQPAAQPAAAQQPADAQPASTTTPPPSN